MAKSSKTEEDVSRGSARLSLERLKALDTLPDIPSQLREAQQLCNHSARAEMICKWLLGKLKLNSEFRESSDAWDALLSALRLLTPPQVAIVLSSFDFLEICKATLEYGKEGRRTEVFWTLAKVVRFLLELASDPHGLQVKAVLSLGAADAASFLNLWIQCAIVVERSPPFKHDGGPELPRPGTQIWNLRKRTPNENDLFAKHCLLSVSRLFSMIKLHEDTNQLKRKRDNECSPQQEIGQILEAMLARHIFVPARIAFFKALDSADTSGRRQAGSQDPAQVLKAMLYPLQGGTLQDSASADDQISNLLEVALRCTPMITPKQRTRERSWVDATFQALQDCNGVINDSDSVRQVLNGMLLVIKAQKADLSKLVLDGIIERYSGLGSGLPVHWDLIALVIALNNDVFSDEKLVSTLFLDINDASLHFSDTDPPQLKSPTRTRDSTKDWKPTETDFSNSLRKDIVAPVMRGFADSRKLDKFVDLWVKQLDSEGDAKTPFMWTDLTADVAPLIEESLTEDKVTEIFDHHLTLVQSAAKFQSSDVNSASRTGLEASIVILDAVLSGVRSESLADRLYDRAGWTLNSIMSLVAREHVDSFQSDLKHLAPSTVSQTWSLMTRAFELWFPAWVVLQTDVEVIAEKGTDIVTSTAFTSALLAHSKSGSARRSPLVKKEAGRFVASISQHLREHNQALYIQEQLHVSCLQAADQLDLETVLGYPDLIATLESGRLNDLIIDGAWEPSTATLRVIVPVVFLRSPSEDVDRLVEILIHCIRHVWDDDEGEHEHDDEITSKGERLCELREKAVLDVLLGITPDSITRPHREEIINAVSLRQQESDRDERFDIQTGRLALVAHFTTINNATCTLSTDPEELWRLAQSVSTVQYDEECEAEGLVEELSKRQMDHWLKTQVQGRTQSVLVEFSSLMKARMEFICQRGQLDGSGKTLHVLGPLICQLEAGAKHGLQSRLGYRDAKLVGDFLGLCFCSIIAVLSVIEMDIVETSWLQPALKLLLDVPDSLIQLSAIDTGEWHGAFEKSMKSLDALKHLNIENSDHVQSATRSVFVLCFKVVCRYAATDRWSTSILVQAHGLADMQLHSSVREEFLTSFVQYIDKLDDKEFVGLFESLLSEGILRQTRFVLVEKCASRLDKTNTEDVKVPLSRILARLFTETTKGDDVLFQKGVIGCVATIFRRTTSAVNQHTVEMTLMNLQTLLEDWSNAPILYQEVCRVLSTLLLQYRSRLHGRLHLVNQVFQALLSRLFKPTHTSTDTRERGSKVGIKHAQALSKLLTLLCEPPQLRRQLKNSELVDESRKEQAYVGQFTQYILHHYCSQVLTGKMEPGVREALMPGLWSMIEAMEMGDAEGVKSLSAAMNNSERAVLRGVYDDWRRFGKWSGA